MSDIFVLGKSIAEAKEYIEDNKVFWPGDEATPIGERCQWKAGQLMDVFLVLPSVDTRESWSNGSRWIAMAKRYIAKRHQDADKRIIFVRS